MKGVIEQCSHENGEFISNIFLGEKKDGSHRMILNLKKFNKNVVYHKFKMDTLETVIKLVKPNCSMASVDLKDAYYTVFIAKEHQKYLRFSRKGKIYQFTCLPNGLASAPRLFTKLLKPVLAKLRLQGHVIVGYIDDLYLQGDTPEDCLANVKETVQFFSECGFIIHPTKSVLVPSTSITYLGFQIDSKDMIVKMTREKMQNIAKFIEVLLSQSKLTIRKFAELIGIIVASFPGVQFGPLHYRALEMAKTTHLKLNFGNYEALITLSDDCKSELKWWIENISTQIRVISHGNPQITLFSDSSKKGWGAHNGKESIGGEWSLSEQEYHINYLELLALFFALKSFCSLVRNQHVRVFTDNSTAMVYVNKMGGTRSPLCNQLTKDIWSWCQERNIWISAGFVPGKDNTVADHRSRNLKNDRTEWMLDKNLFAEIIKVFGTPDIDLFASRLNRQLPNYVSWHPDPDAKYVDAFSLDWSKFYFYAFPPFSLLTRCLQKVIQDQAEGIIIAPAWPTQAWFTQLIKLSQNTPVRLKMSRSTLVLPMNDKQHPFWKNLHLKAYKLSARH